MQPLTFNFRANHSFLSYANHPVTVPRSQLPYARIRRAGLSAGAIEIRFAGMVRVGVLYRGMAGYGEYFQVRVTDGRGLPTRDVHVGQLLRVELGKDDAAQFASLTIAWAPGYRASQPSGGVG